MSSRAGNTIADWDEAIMATRRRTWMVLGLAVILVTAYTAFLLQQVSLRRRAAAIDSAIQNGPLRLSIIESGGNVPGDGRELHLDPPDKVTLRIHSRGSGWELPLPIVNVPLGINSGPTVETRRFGVAKGQLDELRQALVREHFFDLDDSYGELFAGRRTTVLVYAGEFKKAVELCCFGVKGEPEQLREPSRALRVLQVVLAWFDDPDLNEMRKWNRELIHAAGK
jgi:hypothetical protein